MPTLTPPFAEFLPRWLSAQPWYAGGRPQPVGRYRLEDPAGEVGIEGHLVRAGGTVHHVPVTYRGAPLPAAGLVATAEHSELGSRWIYDAVTDPVWLAAVEAFVRDGADVPDGPVILRGCRADASLPGPARVEVVRALRPGAPVSGPGVVGTLLGRWPGADAVPVEGPLAVVRAAGAGP